MLDLHRQTVLRSVEVVAAIRDDQWDLPTPCAQWTVRDLLAHMIRENRGFAVAAGGETLDRSVWTSAIGADVVSDYATSAARVIAAFAVDGVLDRAFWLPCINDAITFPGRQAVSFHLLDYLVHAWDVAISTGQPMPVDDDVVAAVHEIAMREVPDGPRRYRVGANFAPPIAMPVTAPAMDQLLAFLGRNPGWRASADI